jgi:hypothetical protein
VTLSGTKPFATLVAEMVSKIGTGKDADDTVVVRGGFRYAPAPGRDPRLRRRCWPDVGESGLVATAGLSLIF